MIQTDKLVQFYCAQYKTFAKKKHKKTISETGPYPKRMQRLSKELLAIHSPKIKQPQLENYHRQLRNLSYFVYRDANPIYIMQFETYLVAELVRLDISSLRDEEPELITERFLNFLYQEMPLAICRRTLKDLCHQYGQFGMRHQIVGMVPLKPETEFPQTRGMQRHFILHVGPTNCGKTYHALERLKEASCGVYLGPLRLLALEIHEKMKDAGIACTMLTGEECIPEENSRITSSTIEMLDMEQHYDIAVIDEAQMIADRDRGHSWTRAILGVKADEIHICMSPAAEEVVTHLIALCEDTFEIRHYERKTALVCEQEAFVFPDDVTEGDALITFTKRAVLDIAGRLEREGIRASVIYGSLPPEIRRRQIRLFLSRETKVVVSTDAIGLGVNLPIRRVIFMDDQKFDGVSRRPLNGKEVRQIAGRAGRYLLYPTGYVNAHGQEMLDYVRKAFTADTEPITQARLGFPSELLDLSEPLDRIIEEWGNIQPSEPFVKVETTDVLFLYHLLEKHKEQIAGFEDKHTIYRMITCNIDVKNNEVIDQWLEYCKTYAADVCVEKPEQIYGHDELISLENYYKKLDLYFQFSNRLGKEMDLDFVLSEKADTEARITELLKNNKRRYIPKCRVCGRTLTIAETTYGICNKCHAKRMMV